MSLPITFTALGAAVTTALLRRREGTASARRWPVLTLAMALAIGLMFAIQHAVPDLLALLGREPALLDKGEVWRAATALFVQDGGVPGVLFNLFWLLVIGSLAEWKLGSARWAMVYFGGGILTEFLALYWQPYGAGNSVAYFALAGALIAHLDGRGMRLLQMLARAAGLACGVALAAGHDIHGVAFLIGAGFGGVFAYRDRRASAAPPSVGPIALH